MTADRREKVTGVAEYTFDIALAGMLHGKLLRSPHPHARVLRIDTARALAMPGVACVVTGADLVGLAETTYGVLLHDQPVIATDRVRYVGDPVAAVVAVDEATAFRAAAAIHVAYDPLPALMTPDAATAPGAPLLFDQPTPGQGPMTGPGTEGHVDPAPNVLYAYRFRYGDADAALAAADHVFTDRFAFSAINHFHLEPHVNVARWRGGRLELWSCNQDPFVLRGDCARIFGLPLTHVRVHTPLIGGGFGGKSYCKMEPLLALMARRAGAPVRLALSMDESLLTLTKHAAVLELTTGVDATGRLAARRAAVTLDGGAYADASAMVAAKTAYRIGGPYRWQAIDARARSVRTTKVPAGSFRGFGATQASWASESQIDMIARRLGHDPVAFRERNLLHAHEAFAPGDSGIDCDLRAGLRELTTRLGWISPRTPGRGLGVAVGLKDGGGTANHAQAMVKLLHTGEAVVQAAVAEIGQGARTALCRLAAEVLGLPEDRIRYAPIDTDVTPPDNGTHVSGGTTVTGLAIVAAAADARRQVLAFAAEQWGCPPEELVLDGWSVRRGNRVESLEPMILAHYGGVGWDFVGRGHWKQPRDAAAPLGARSPFWMPCWSGIDLSVDTQTGRITVHRLVVGADAGRVIDAPACRGQIEGAAIQALSQALFEELRYDAAGTPSNATPLAYRVMQTPDLPEAVECFVAEHGLGVGPRGVKGIGEAGMVGIAAAVANAIEDAVGVRLTALPFTPEAVLAALDARGAGP